MEFKWGKLPLQSYAHKIPKRCDNAKGEEKIGEIRLISLIGPIGLISPISLIRPIGRID
ncbi:hypothetical protein [uncultured Duncaniella sp.]|uniref:hypothetical protein n=1 Tax=uncultured Duncaniella sp. TaxID=2768039 RepID=UPI002608C541|nr:hypothetical protein [uncultured Duncaniella sp.]